MPSGLQLVLQNRLLQLEIAGTLAALLLILFIVFRGTRKDPSEMERLRRSFLNENGRLGTGIVSEVHGNIVHFSYRVGGMEYVATQDISAIRDCLPSQDDHLYIGPCSVKYLPDNPANSMVLCEQWNGLRTLIRS